MVLKFTTWLVFFHLFACSFAYQGAIDATKPQTFYPGAAPAAPPSSLQGTQGIVTIPRSAPAGILRYPASPQGSNYRDDLEVVYVGYAADGSPVLSIRPAQPAVSSSPKENIVTLLPAGRASSSGDDDLVTSKKHSDVAILRILLRLIRVLQRQQELEQSGKSTSSFNVLGYPRHSV